MLLLLYSFVPMKAQEQSIVRILAIGDNFISEAMESNLYDIAQASGTRLVLGNACGVSYSLQDHWEALSADLADLEYRKCENRHYTIRKGYTLNAILSDEPWDYVIFQQTARLAGLYESYEPWLTNLISHVKSKVQTPNTRYGLYMVWAYAQDATLSQFGNYNYDQMTMYNGIVDATGKVMQAHPELDFLIPSGTAIQNIRTSFIKDNVMRDGIHPTPDLGQNTVAYSWFATLFGTETMMQNPFVPYTLNDFTAVMAKNAVLSAIKAPYSITQQIYSNYYGENLLIPSDININFSHEGMGTDGWNDVTLHHLLTAGFKDIDGADCAMYLQCEVPFEGANFSGPQQTSTMLDMPASVSQTALWSYSQGDFEGMPQSPSAILHFKHLNKAFAYDFTFFSSREYSTDNRETQYTLAGMETKTAALDASDNKSGSVTIPNMRPDQDGTITLTVQAGPNNNNPYKFYYLNALRISLRDTIPTVRVMALGNSFTIDAMESDLYDMAQASGVRLVLGDACRGGYSLENHWNALANDMDVYEYRKCKNRHYTVKKGYTLKDILADENWDYIVFQQTSAYAGLYNTYEPYLTNLINSISSLTTNPDVKYGFYMVWAYEQSTANKNFDLYNRNQMTMWNGIADATHRAMNAHPELEILIPTGTAVQNIRTSFIGDNVTRDAASHLTVNMGRAIAGYSWLGALFGTEMLEQNPFMPYNLNGFTTMMAKNAVLSAIEAPYAVSLQNYPDYVGANTIVPADININFSFEGTGTEGWNDFTLHNTLTAGYKDSKGNDSGIIIQCDNPFMNALTDGYPVTNTVLDMPTEVSQTALVGYTADSSVPPSPTTLYIKHLNKSLLYDFTFFSSRAYSTDNRETQFTLTGSETKTVALDASNNKKVTATISDMRPDSDGTITLTVSAGPNNNNPNRYYYFNALRIWPYDPNDADGIKAPAFDTPPTCRPSARKVIRDKHLYIIKDDKTYTPDGKRVR